MLPFRIQDLGPTDSRCDHYVFSPDRTPSGDVDDQGSVQRCLRSYGHIHDFDSPHYYEPLHDRPIKRPIWEGMVTVEWVWPGLEKLTPARRA